MLLSQYLGYKDNHRMPYSTKKPLQVAILGVKWLEKPLQYINFVQIHTRLEPIYFSMREHLWS